MVKTNNTKQGKKLPLGVIIISILFFLLGVFIAGLYTYVIIVSGGFLSVLSDKEYGYMALLPFIGLFFIFVSYKLFSKKLWAKYTVAVLGLIMTLESVGILINAMVSLNMLLLITRLIYLSLALICFVYLTFNKKVKEAFQK